MPDAGVDVEAHHLHVHHALQHVQARACAVEAGVVALGPLRADLSGILAPACQPMRVRRPRPCRGRGPPPTRDGWRRRRPLQQHHALAAEPDIAILGREGDGLRQLLGRGQPAAAELVGLVDDQALLPAEQLLEEFIPMLRPGLLEGLRVMVMGREVGTMLFSMPV